MANAVGLVSELKTRYKIILVKRVFFRIADFFQILNSFFSVFQRKVGMLNLRRGLLICFLIGRYFIVIFTYTIVFEVRQSFVLWNCHQKWLAFLDCGASTLECRICTLSWQSSHTDLRKYDALQLTNLQMCSPKFVIMSSCTYSETNENLLNFFFIFALSEVR